MPVVLSDLRRVEPITQPLKWHGGKSYLAGWIVSQMPPRAMNPNAPNDEGWLHYVEPFFGGGAVLLAQNPVGISEVINDRNFQLQNFWNVLKDDDEFAIMQRVLNATPFSKLEFEAAEEMLQRAPTAGGPEQAAKFFINCRQSMAGRMDSFAPLTRNRTRRGMNEQASAWLNCVEGLPAVHERLRRVAILNDEAVKVIKQQDGTRTLFYCDPPYLHETRAATGVFQHEMTTDDHRELLNTLAGVKGRFMLSGYHSGLYDDFARSHGWQCREKCIDNKSSSAKTKAIKTECLWTN